MRLKHNQFAFGPFLLDPADRTLFRDQNPIPLAPKAFDTLLYLTENSRRLVSREELMKSIWPGSVVEDANLTVNISLLRKALGNAHDGQAYIQTIPRKGYRFNGEIKLIEPDIGLQPPSPQELGSTEVSADKKANHAEAPSYRRSLAGAILGLVALGVLAGFFGARDCGWLNSSNGALPVSHLKRRSPRPLFPAAPSSSPMPILPDSLSK